MHPYATGPTSLPYQQPRDYSWWLFASGITVIGLWFLYMAIAVLELVVQVWARAEQGKPLLLPTLPSFPGLLGSALFYSPFLGFGVPLIPGGVLLLTRPAAVRRLAHWGKANTPPKEAAVHVLWFGSVCLAVYVLACFASISSPLVPLVLLSGAIFPRLLVWILRRWQKL